MIFQNIPLKENIDISISSAKDMGALMLFGEKYGDKVRVIEFGESKELCGGTHVNLTSEIGVFKIITESSVASGIRRIEAKTAFSALQTLNDKYETVKKAETLLKTQDILLGIDKLINENKSLESIKNKLEKESLSHLVDDLILSAEKFGEIHFISKHLKINSNSLKDISFIIREKKKVVAILGILSNDKINVGLFISNDLITKDFNAKDLISKISDKISGSGGGQPHFAVAGGNNPKGFTDAASSVSYTHLTLPTKA